MGTACSNGKHASVYMLRLNFLHALLPRPLETMSTPPGVACLVASCIRACVRVYV